MVPPDPSQTRTWLEESAWLHRLARRLVHESAQAEDAAQDALIVAWKRAPDESVSMRAWLGGVLRNVVRARRREDVRRTAREHDGARPEALEESAHDGARLVERLDVHARLVAAVRGLDEPYRTTVALRYLDELSVDEVARRTNVPAKTVHTRLERALAKLRERLDREFGERSTWASVLLPIPFAPHASPSSPLSSPTAPAAPSPIHVQPTSSPVAPPRVPPADVAGPLAATPIPLAPILAMSTLTKWSAVVVAALVVTFWATRSVDRSASTTPVTASARSSPSTDSHPDTTTPLEPTGSGERTRASEPVTTHVPAVAVAVGATPARVRGFVVDVSKRPVAGLEVAYELVRWSAKVSEPTITLPPGATSTEDGSFEIELFDKPARLVARGLGLATFYAPALVGVVPSEPPTIVVGPARDYAGLVVDSDGAPIAGADVTLWPDTAIAARVTTGNYAVGWQVARTSTDERGRFETPTIGFAPGTRLQVTAPGHEAYRAPLPESSDTHMTVTLARSERPRGTYEGRVEFEDGTPAANAYVSAGAHAERTDSEGRFAFTPGEAEKPERLVAVLEGHLPATQSLVGLDEERRTHLVLVLGGRGRVLAGRVVDADGKAVVGARVWTNDGERFGSLVTRLGDMHYLFTYDVEGVVDGLEDGPTDGRDRRTDAQGRFELAGLVDREYSLLVEHPETHEVAGPFAFASDRRDVVLTIAGLEPRRRVAGRVVNLAGAPIEGATVRVLRARAVRSARFARDFAGAAEPRRTDAEGRFEFPSLCTEGTTLLVTSKDGGSETSSSLAGVKDLDDVRVELAGRGSFRVLFADATQEGFLQVEDAAGANLDLQFSLNGTVMRSSAVMVDGPASELLEVSETARTLVIQRGTSPEVRMPIRIVPGEVQTIRM